MAKKKKDITYYATTKELHNNTFFVIELRDSKTGSIKKRYTHSGRLIVYPSVSGEILFYTYKLGTVRRSVSINMKNNKRIVKLLG